MVIRRHLDQFYYYADYPVQSRNFARGKLSLHHKLGTRFVFERLGNRTRAALGEPRTVGEALALQSSDKNQDADADHGRRKRLERPSDQWRADVPKPETPRRADIAGSLPGGLPGIF